MVKPGLTKLRNYLNMLDNIRQAIGTISFAGIFITSLFLINTDNLFGSTEPLIDVEHQKFEENVIKIEKIQLKRSTVRLYNLNPFINKWFLLEIKGSKTYRIHMESRNENFKISLSNSGIDIYPSSHSKAPFNCKLWDQDPEAMVSKSFFAKYQNPYYPVCNGLLFIRLQRSSKTKLSLTEWSTEILRKTDFGENIINTFKPFIVSQGAEPVSDIMQLKTADAPEYFRSPKDALSNPGKAKQISLAEHQLGISLNYKNEQIVLGKWYESQMHNNIFVSLFTPSQIPAVVLSKDENKTYPIEATELDKMIYLIAYDLSKYQIRYAAGTTQPPIETGKEVYGKSAPLRKSFVSVGSVPPYLLQQAVGVFIGGFKKRHAIFKQGPHKGKGYGYIESGVELAPMHSGLATLLNTKSGDVDIIKWPETLSSGQDLRKKTISARQNGVLIIDNYAPGNFVKHWKEGNWSADAQGVRTSLRSGVCLQSKGQNQNFLIFFAFTSATPSTMAKVMQAYSCKSGMHLDMNAYMYLHNALFKFENEQNIVAEYLNKEMLYPPGLKRHRFIMDNNRRDFFYVIRKEDKDSNRIAKNSEREKTIKDELTSFFEYLESID